MSSLSSSRLFMRKDCGTVGPLHRTPPQPPRAAIAPARQVPPRGALATPSPRNRGHVSGLHVQTLRLFDIPERWRNYGRKQCMDKTGEPIGYKNVYMNRVRINEDGKGWPKMFTNGVEKSTSVMLLLIKFLESKTRV
jgi:hypothetical protein